MWSGPARQSLPASGGEGSLSSPLRVASLNLAHGRGEWGHQIFTSRTSQAGNITDIAQRLRVANVDIVALQEADGCSWWNHRANLVAALSDAMGWHTGPRASQIRGWGLDYGTALISRGAIHSPRGITWPGVWGTPAKGAIAAEVLMDDRPVTIVSLHLDPASKQHRRKQIHSLEQWLANVETPLIVAGDFNGDWNAPDEAVRLLASLRHLKPWPLPATTDPTFRWGARLDWILVSDALEICNPQIDQDAPSDHALITADITWKKEVAREEPLSGK
ncbi:MAG: hypothetical protein EA401_02550 [Planctomycetota bacterium]|nr:MAG: hypothetical protein EA401_02550 [Planctomycetota bacterium]